VYSAGIVLFEMLTGKVPYDGDVPVDVAWQHVDNDVPKPSSVVHGVPAALDDLVARATRRDAGARPTDAGAMLAEVQVVRDDLGAANVETAVLRQVPSRHAVTDATTVVPAYSGTARPTWARLPEQGGRRVPPPGAPLERLHALRSDKRRLLLLAAVAVMVLTVVGTAWYVTVGRYTQAPQLVNMTRPQAEAAAKQDGFGLVYTDGQYSETAPKDTVLAQKPSAAEKIVNGGTITLKLSLGPERHPVPDLTGVELSAAKGQLDGQKLLLKQGTSQYSDTVPEGSVISTDPKADTALKPGSTVTVVVSKGKAPITVPDLSGKNINDARSQLAALGLTAVEQYKQNDAQADTVIGQSPKAGTGVAKDAEIKLDVSQGPPAVTVPDLTNQPCQQAAQKLQQMSLQPQIQFNPNGFVRNQQPAPNTQVPPQTPVILQCI
jgi:serine/threonine-protein kinase